MHISRTCTHALCQKFEDLMVDNIDVTSNPLSAEQIPRRSVLNKSHKVTAGPMPEDTAVALICQPHKPSQAQAPQWGSPQQRPPVSKNCRSASVTGTIPRHSPLPVVDSSHLHQGQCQP
jgi:growth factor receptor bound protein 2-associated protein 2